MTLKGFINNVVNMIRLILKRPLFIRDFLSINPSINQKKIKKMEEFYRKGSDDKGREFIEKRKSDTNTNWFGIIATAIVGILIILLITLIVKSYYKDKFQQEKEKLEIKNPAPAPVITKTITKEIVKEPAASSSSLKEEYLELLLMQQAQQNSQASAPVVAPVPAKKEKGPIAKAAEEKVVGQLKEN